ncbi:MAG TPA: septum formation initiator family protein [Ktedonobacterales bacterium]|nr:septum formation initiator family protein [Ktedonobacterales bacterium]
MTLRDGDIRASAFPTSAASAANHVRLAAMRRAQRRRQRPAALTRALTLWATLALCVVLLVGVGSELWTGYQLQQQVAQTQAQNAALQHDIARTQRATSQAQSPTSIERTARAWGYARDGETPVVIAAPTPASR